MTEQGHPSDKMAVGFAICSVLVVLALVALAAINLWTLQSLHSLLSSHSAELAGINSLLHQFTNASVAGNHKYVAALVAERSIIAHQNQIIHLLHILLASK